MAYNFVKDQLAVYVLQDRGALGKVAAKHAGDRIKALCLTNNEVNIVFAAAPSQAEFLDALIDDKEINWKKINAFHMDEYIGLAPGAPQSFGLFLEEKVFKRVPFKSVNLINGQAADLVEECHRYSSLLSLYPPDVVCMGIGENTHLAFNDPPEARFNDPEMVKIVRLEEVCRQQQVNDKCFDNIDDVPMYAVTLTIPALIQSAHIFCMVPGKKKAEAVRHTLNSPVSEQFPSTILRRHPDASLYLDMDSVQSSITGYS
jgi:glucosamine-6-phosphate deaminase